MMQHVYCDKCNLWILDVDTEKLDMPLTGDMFVVPVDSPFGRTWAGPRGLITPQLACPECENFPFYANFDGVVQPLLRIRDLTDPRFFTTEKVEKLKTVFIKDKEHGEEEPVPIDTAAVPGRGGAGAPGVSEVGDPAGGGGKAGPAVKEAEDPPQKSKKGKGKNIVEEDLGWR